MDSISAEAMGMLEIAGMTDGMYQSEFPKGCVGEAVSKGMHYRSCIRGNVCITELTSERPQEATGSTRRASGESAQECSRRVRGEPKEVMGKAQRSPRTHRNPQGDIRRAHFISVGTPQLFVRWRRGCQVFFCAEQSSNLKLQPLLATPTRILNDASSQEKDCILQYRTSNVGAFFSGIAACAAGCSGGSHCVASRKKTFARG